MNHAEAFVLKHTLVVWASVTHGIPDAAEQTFVYTVAVERVNACEAAH
jgi:hypothetical protein